MHSMMVERECRGKYCVAGHFEEFERGTFLGYSQSSVDVMTKYKVPGQISMDDYLQTLPAE